MTPKPDPNPFLRHSAAALPMLLALACSTGCPGDDVTGISTSDGGSTGSATTDTPTTDTPTTDTPTTIDPTTAGSTSEGSTTTLDSTGTAGESGTSSDTESESGTAGETGTDPVCGDGVMEGDEACDGADIPTDCVAEGFDGGDIACADDCTLDIAACEVNCGNDIVDEGEDCDGADLGGVDDCVGLDPDMYMGGALGCAVDCTYDLRLCEVITCGNGVLDGMDTCDGDDLGDETCVSQGFDGGTLACEAGCAAFDTTGCTYTCGDDGIDPPETCDGVDLGVETCATQGFDGGTLACAADCGTFDTSGCFVCGDDVAEGPEVCDGADLLGEDCVSQGFAGGGTLGCAADCGGFDTSLCVAEFCGDGVINGAEECDGDDVGGADCVVEGFLGGQVTCSADCTLSTDTCFDGNTTICSTPGTPVGPGPGDPDAVDTISVGGAGNAVVDVDVFVDVSHTWATDMEIDIDYVSSGAAPVRLFDNGCGGSNFDNMDVTFDDEAAGPPSCGNPIGGGGSGTPVQPLSSFDGLGDGGGDWQITIGDTIGGDGGTLNEWCVTLSTNSTAPFCGDGVVGGTEACEGNEIASTTCESLGFVGGSPSCSPGCSIDTTECSDAVVAACSSPGSLITVGAPVADVITIPAGSGTISDLDVHVDITHTWSSDLDMFLTHDLTGTVVELSTDQCGSGDDVFAFFNDEADGLPDCVAPVAIEGNITPEGVLANFDGELADGDWTLGVTDDAGGDDGTLNTWCIYITP